VPPKIHKDPRTAKPADFDADYYIEESEKQKMPGFEDLLLFSDASGKTDHDLHGSLTSDGKRYECAVMTLSDGHLRCVTDEQDSVAYVLDGNFLEVPSPENESNTNVLNLRIEKKAGGLPSQQATVLMKWWSGE
jgi:hypothetical protein